MKPTPSKKGSLVLNISLVLLAVMGLAWWQSVITTQETVCRVCSAESSKNTLLIRRHIIGSWEAAPKPSFLTTNYFDRYLAYPHSHQWIYKNGATLTATGPPPTHRLMQLTFMAYQLVAASGIPAPEDRRRYFESIIRLQDPGHHSRVENTHLKIASQVYKSASGYPTDNRVWGPAMEGVTVPDEVKAGGLPPASN